MPEVLYSSNAENTLKNTGSAAPVDAIETRELINHWYTLRQGRYWALVNIIFSVMVGVSLWTSLPSTMLLSWCLFTTLNALLFLFLVDGAAAAADTETSSTHSPTIFFAGIFGAAWGGLIFLSAGQVEPLSFFKIQLLMLTIAALAIPVFALQNGAYTTFSVAAIIPLLASQSGGNEVIGLGFFLTLFVMLYIAAAYVANTQRSLAVILEKFLSLGGQTHKTTPRDSREFLKVADKRYRKIARLIPGQQRAKTSLDAVGDGVITTNRSGIIEYLNPIAEVMIGATKAQALGEAIDSLLNLRCSETQQNIASAMESIRQGSSTQIKRRATLVREDGLEYQLELIVLPINDSDGFCDGASFILREISEQNSLAKEAQWRASHDPLTKLINRIEFESRLKKLLDADEAQQTELRHAMCVFDLDKFQFINETYGHQCGDKALVALAEEFKSKIRGADSLARVGDNKFAALLYSCSLDKARMIAEGLRRIAEETAIEIENGEINITISAGVVEINPNLDTLTDILVAADSACVNAKKEGGNRVFTVFRGDQRTMTVHQDIERLRSIQSALRDNRLALYTQAVHRVVPDHTNLRRTDAMPVTHCEILLRMEDGNGHLSAPREMLATAQRFQIMPELDWWASKATFDAVRFNYSSLDEMDTIFISLSGQSLNDDKFLDHLLTELSEDSLPTEKICFEISHASLISSIERAAVFVANLKEFGCQVALKDFGFAMNAFELLKRLQIDYLKIDEQFVRNMAHNSVDYEIVLALSRIAKTLRIQTIAEGVSTVTLRETLTGMGIDFMQGLLLDAPQPIIPKKPSSSIKGVD